MTQPTDPDSHAGMLNAMRRAIAASFPACWKGDACPHPTREACPCLDAASLAFAGLTDYLANQPRLAPAPDTKLALRLAILARHLGNAANAQPAAHGLPPLLI